MENADEIESNLASLIEAGFQLAIDDFGTGYCSRPTCPGCRVATPKLDRSHPGAGHQPGHHRHSAPVIGLATSSASKSPPKGWRFYGAGSAGAGAAGCDRLQGYLFSRPAPADFARNHQLPA